MSNIKHTHHNPTGSLERFLNLLLIFTFISSIVVMTLKGGTSGACAACKYQRRRCTEDCPLAPYFPAEQTKLFQNVHRLFGVRSIVKILENLDESQKPEAMKSIIFQSYVRDRSPIHGCLGVTQQLQYMIWHVEEELKVVNSQLHLYRSQQNGHNNNQMIHEIGGDKQEDVTSQQLDLGMGLTVNNSNITPFFSALQVSETQPQMSYTYGSEVNGYNSPPLYTDSKEIQTNHHNNNVGWAQNSNVYPYNILNGFEDEIKNHNKAVMEIQSQQDHHEDVAHEFDAIHQFLEITDERQSFVDQKEVYASSSGESSKEQIGEMGENELRSAATCFSLTSVN